MASNNHTLISRGTRIVGDLFFSGELHVEGKVEGNIVAEEPKDAKLVVSESGVVEGEIRSPVVVINGRVQGNIHSAKHLELAKKAVVVGTVNYSAIEIVNGAKIDGNLISSAAVAPLELVATKAKEKAE